MNRRGILAGLAGLGTLPALHARAADEPIRIGVLNDQSGVFADVGGIGSVTAARLAAEDFGNALNGRRIEVITANHGNNPDLASSIARRWIDQDGVSVIADGAASSAGFAIQTVCREKGRIFIIAGPGSSDFTGKACAPLSFHFNYDTYALAKLTSQAIVAAGGKSWFFIRADYAFGQALERDATAFITAAGGRVVGSAPHPLNNADFSAQLLQAQSSGAQVVGLATSGTDLQTVVKQAGEFGITRGGQKLAGLLVFITDLAPVGLEVAQGLQVTTSFYWDTDDRTRAWTKRYLAVNGAKPPTMVHAGVYSGVRHALRAMQATGQATGGTDLSAVAAAMHATPVDDMYNDKVQIRPDGRVLHQMMLVQVKAPSASRYPNDDYDILTRVPGAEAFRPLNEGGCPLVKA